MTQPMDPLCYRDNPSALSCCSASMQTEEGRGVSSGIEYLYTLSRYKWHATYECRIHRCLLEKEGVIFTKHFVVDNRCWSVSLDHDKEGKLAAYLFSKNWNSVTVHFSFTLINMADVEKTKSRGDCYTFPAYNDGWGFGDLTQAATVLNPSTGYLTDEFFHVRLDMRIRKPDNESCALSIDGNMATLLWHLRHLKEMSPSRVCSEKFRIGHSDMNLILSPNGPRMTTPNLGIYLHNMNDHPIRVKCAIAALNHDSTCKDKVKERILRIDARQALGWVKFLKCGEMEDESRGFVRNARINFAVEITLLEMTEEKKDAVNSWQRLRNWIGRKKRRNNRKLKSINQNK